MERLIWWPICSARMGFNAVPLLTSHLVSFIWGIFSKSCHFRLTRSHNSQYALSLTFSMAKAYKYHNNNNNTMNKMINLISIKHASTKIHHGDSVILMIYFAHTHIRTASLYTYKLKLIENHVVQAESGLSAIKQFIRTWVNVYLALEHMPK